MEMTIPATEGKWCSADESANCILAAIRYIHEKADSLCVDKSKLILDGCSGGGYAVGMACGRLAVLGESNLVKVALMSMAVNPGYFMFKKKEDFKRDITKICLIDGPFVAEAFSTDLQAQWKAKDPVLFPQ